MKTNLQQAWQHQKHMKDSDYLHRSQSYRLLSLLTVKTNYELLRVGQQPCFNLSYCILIFLELPNISSTSLHFYFATTAVIADRGKGTGIMLAKDQRVPSQDSSSNLTEPTHCASHHCSQESREQAFSPDTPRGRGTETLRTEYLGGCRRRGVPAGPCEAAQ